MAQADEYQPLVLVETDGLTREAWLAYRRQGLGGSDAASVLGISPFRTAMDLYYDKRNLPIEDDEGNWVAMEVGTLLEDLVARISALRSAYPPLSAGFFLCPLSVAAQDFSPVLLGCHLIEPGRLKGKHKGKRERPQVPFERGLWASASAAEYGLDCRAGGRYNRATGSRWGLVGASCIQL